MKRLLLLHLLVPLFRLLLSSFSCENATSLAEGGFGESKFYGWCDNFTTAFSLGRRCLPYGRRMRGICQKCK